MKNIVFILTMLGMPLIHAAQSQDILWTESPEDDNDTDALGYVTISNTRASHSDNTSLPTILVSKVDAQMTTDGQTTNHERRGSSSSVSARNSLTSSEILVPSTSSRGSLNSILWSTNDNDHEDGDDVGYVKLLEGRPSAASLLSVRSTDDSSKEHLDSGDNVSDSGLFAPASPRGSWYSDAGFSMQSSSSDEVSLSEEEDFIHQNVYKIVFKSPHATNIKESLHPVGFLDKYAAAANSHDYYLRLLGKMEYYIFDPIFQEAIKKVKKNFKFKKLHPHDIDLDEGGLTTVQDFRSVIIDHKLSFSNKPKSLPLEKIQEAQHLLKIIFKEYKRLLKTNKTKTPTRIDTRANTTLSEIKDALYRVHKKINSRLDILEMEFTYDDLSLNPKVNMYLADSKGGVRRFDKEPLISCTGYRAEFLYHLLLPEIKIVKDQSQTGHLRIKTLIDFFDNKLIVFDLRNELNRSLSPLK